MPDEVVRLAPVVELLQQRPPELRDHLDEAELAARRSVCRSRKPGDVLHRGEVLRRRRSRMSGRCTLTATSRPSRSVARCTCPSDAAAIGSASNGSNPFDSRTPKLLLERSARRPRTKTARRSSCSRPSASRYGGGSRSARVDSSCPSLMNAGPSRSRSAGSSSGAGAPSADGSSSPASASSSPARATRSERPYL